MIEREKLEREIHQLRQIIRADAYALASKSAIGADLETKRYHSPR